MAEAVATELQAVGAHAHAVRADIEGVLAYLRRARVAVGYHHCRQGSAIENGSIPSAVGIANVVDRQPLAGVEADDQAPVLPFHLVAVDLEARPLGLGDLEWL